MKTGPQAITVSIMGKQFTVSCADNERNQLLAAAEYLDEKMARIHSSGKVIGLERCAVMAALNMAHELLEMRRGVGVPQDFEGRLKGLQQKIDNVLLDQKELEL